MDVNSIDHNASTISYKDASTLNQSLIKESTNLSSLIRHKRYQSIIDQIRNRRSQNILQNTKVETKLQDKLKKHLLEKKMKNRNYLPSIKVKMIEYPKSKNPKYQTTHQQKIVQDNLIFGQTLKLKKLKLYKFRTEQDQTQKFSFTFMKSQLLNHQLKFFGEFLKNINDKQNNNPILHSRAWKKATLCLPKPYQLYTEIITKYEQNSKFVIKGESLDYLAPHPIHYLNFYQTHMPNNSNFHLRFVKTFFKDGKEPFTYNKFELFYQIFMKNNLKQLDVPIFIYDFFTYQTNSSSCILKCNFYQTLKILVENSLKVSHSKEKIADIYQYIRNLIESKLSQKITENTDQQFIEKQLLKQLILNNPEISFILFVMMMRRED